MLCLKDSSSYTNHNEYNCDHGDISLQCENYQKAKKAEKRGKTLLQKAIIDK